MNSNDFFNSMPKEPLGREMVRQKCNYLSKFIPTIFGLFQWFGAKEEDECICTLQYLGYKLYRALDMAKKIYEERGKLLQDEKCGSFGAIIKQHDIRMRNIKKFIVNADMIIESCMGENSPLLDFGKKRLITKFKALTSWVQTLLSNTELYELAVSKCDSLNLNYDISDTNDIPGDFRQQVNSLFNILILLSIPSHISADGREFATLLINSLESFKKSETWKEYLRCFLIELDDDFLASELPQDKEWEFLKKKYNELSFQRKEFLESFGIKPMSLTTELSKEKMGAQLYECLNEVYLSENSPKIHKKMEETDFEKYLIHEASLQYLAEKIELLHPKNKCNIEQTKHYDIFNENVDETKLAQAILNVHQLFFGENKKHSLLNKYNKEIDLMAFLFIVIEKLKIGNDNFGERGRKTFFDFCQNKASIDLGNRDKTFYNRLTRNFRSIHDKIRKGKITTADYEIDVYKDFQTVKRFFQETDFFKEWASKKL